MPGPRHSAAPPPRSKAHGSSQALAQPAAICTRCSRRSALGCGCLERRLVGAGGCAQQAQQPRTAARGRPQQGDAAARNEEQCCLLGLMSPSRPAGAPGGGRGRKGPILAAAGQARRAAGARGGGAAANSMRIQLLFVGTSASTAVPSTSAGAPATRSSSSSLPQRLSRENIRSDPAREPFGVWRLTRAAKNQLYNTKQNGKLKLTLLRCRGARKRRPAVPEHAHFKAQSLCKELVPERSVKEALILVPTFSAPFAERGLVRAAGSPP